MAGQREKTGGRTGQTLSDEPKRNIIGERVREARDNNQPKLTQADLAARVSALGVPLNTNAVSKIERFVREVSDYELKAIGEALNVAVAWLLGEKEIL